MNISLYSPSSASYLCDPARWFFFSFFFNLPPFSIQPEDSSKLWGATVVVRVSCSGKSCIPRWKSWHVSGPGDLLGGQGDCQYVSGRLRFFYFFCRVCGQTHMLADSVPPGGCHGSFSLTFSVCANKQLQTDGADDAANSLKNGTQYRLYSRVYCTSLENSTKIQIWNSMIWIKLMNYT